MISVTGIGNGEALIDAFGGWPPFDDANLVSMRLGGEGLGIRALTLVFYFPLGEKPVERYASPNITARYLMTLRFENAVITSLTEYFESWRRIYGLTLDVVSPGENGEAGGRRHCVRILGFPGNDLGFCCDDIVVVSVEAVSIDRNGRLILPGEPAPKRIGLGDHDGQQESTDDDPWRELICRICERPMMFTGRKDFASVALFLSGYGSGEVQAGGQGLSAFNGWLAQTYHASHRIARNLHWTSIIEQIAETDEERFRLLPELYARFVQETTEHYAKPSR